MIVSLERFSHGHEARKENKLARFYDESKELKYFWNILGKD